MDTDKHGGIAVRVDAVYLPRVDHCEKLVLNLVFFSVYLNVRSSVQLVQKLDLLVPVQGMITAGRGGV